MYHHRRIKNLKNNWSLNLTVINTDPGTMPLGVEDKRIRNGGFSASTYYNSALAPWHGRLNHRWSWSGRQRNRKQWLQVYIGVLTRVKGVATQGRQDANQWVKSYKLTYSQDGTRFVPYKVGRRVKVLICYKPVSQSCAVRTTRLV